MKIIFGLVLKEKLRILADFLNKTFIIPPSIFTFKIGYCLGCQNQKWKKEDKSSTNCPQKISAKKVRKNISSSLKVPSTYSKDWYKAKALNN